MSTLEILGAPPWRARQSCRPRGATAVGNRPGGGRGPTASDANAVRLRGRPPEQFAPLLRGRSLLRQTLDRIGLAIPLARTLVVTHARAAAYVAQEFARDVERPECLVQPEDRGTAAAIRWAVHTIARRDPDGVAVVVPSDHYVNGEPTFMGHVLEGRVRPPRSQGEEDGDPG
jgi:nucleotidyltransferase-like protein